MNVVWLLFRNNSRKTLAIIALGLLSGAASTALIAAANDSLYSGSGVSHARWLLALAFVVAVTFKVGSTIASGLLLGHSVQDIMLNMCEGLCRRIAATPLTKLEEIGGPRVMACLTDDVEVLSAAANVIPNLMVDVAMMAGCGIYLAWISWRAAITMVALVVVVVITYRFLLAKAQTAVRLARDSRDTLFQHFRSLVEGIKEIKLHNSRKNAFFNEDVDGTVQYLRQQNVVAMHRYALADAWSQTMYYMLLGVVLFAFPALHHVSLKTLTAYVFMALYMMGPILGIAGCIPYFNRGQASLQKLQELGMALDDIGEIQTAPRDSQPTPERTMTHSPGAPPLVEFRDVVFHHGHEKKGNSFTLGPLSLTLHPGELVFIIGGNGSGKSTLAKLMTGLYVPDSGEILVNGISVSADSQDEYRQLYSAVFSDFYLIDRLLGLDKSGAWAERSKEYLDALGLSHVVKMNGASFSTIALSQGQRRRMALLVAYLEDRPIYVLDEWAADQDPAFRQIFYLKLLPALKEKGKTVVLITHDDRFFHLGDRVIKLDYGKVIETVQQGVPAESVQI